MTSAQSTGKSNFPHYTYYLSQWTTTWRFHVVHLSVCLWAESCDGLKRHFLSGQLEEHGKFQRAILIIKINLHHRAPCVDCYTAIDTGFIWSSIHIAILGNGGPSACSFISPDQLIQTSNFFFEQTMPYCHWQKSAAQMMMMGFYGDCDIFPIQLYWKTHTLVFQRVEMLLT